MEELLRVVNSIQGFQDYKNVDDVKKYITDERFKKQINRQILESVVAELKYKLTTATVSKEDEEKTKCALVNLKDTLSYDSLKQQHETKFQAVLQSGNYREILKVFNSKSLSTSTGNFFGLCNNDYCDYVIRQLGTEKRKQLIDAIVPYLPDEIPRTK